MAYILKMRTKNIFQEQQIPRSLGEIDICYKNTKMSSAVSKLNFLVSFAAHLINSLIISEKHTFATNNASHCRVYSLRLFSYIHGRHFRGEKQI